MPMLESLKTTLEIITTASVILFTIYKLVFRRWYRKYKETEAAHRKAFFDELAKQNVVIGEIRSQVFPNGGGSIFDMQKKTTEQISNIVLKLNSLQASNRNTWDILDIASWESDNEGKVTYVSLGFCDLVGANPSEIMGNSWVGRIATWDRDTVVSTWREAVSNGSEFTLTHSVRKNDGTYQMVTPVVIHNKDEHGKVLNSLGRLLKVGEPYILQKTNTK